MDEMVEIFCLMYSMQVRTILLSLVLPFLDYFPIGGQQLLYLYRASTLRLFSKHIKCFHSQGFTEEEATARALHIFETLDKNGDGSLAEEEFIKVGNSYPQALLAIF